MEKRKCRYCGKRFPIEKFAIAAKVKGKVYRRWKCFKCHHETKNKRRKSIKCWLDDFKKTLACKVCGNDDFRVLDFHHRDGEWEFRIGDATRYGYSKEKIAKEIKKCDPLCSNCHRILHWEEKHGV